MKSTLLTTFLLAAIAVHAQQPLTPADHRVEKKYIADKDYTMTWYFIKDTARIEIGAITTSVRTTNAQVVVVTSVAMKQSRAPWIDSTVAAAADLSPIYHSSRNGNRDMALHFGKLVTG